MEMTMDEDRKKREAALSAVSQKINDYQNDIRRNIGSKNDIINFHYKAMIAELLKIQALLR